MKKLIVITALITVILLPSISYTKDSDCKKVWVKPVYKKVCNAVKNKKTGKVEKKCNAVLKKKGYFKEVK